jgi:hypothetical protein
MIYALLLLAELEPVPPRGPARAGSQGLLDPAAAVLRHGARPPRDGEDTLGVQPLAVRARSGVHDVRALQVGNIYIYESGRECEFVG